MEKYENPIEHTCDVAEGQQWISIDGKQPEGMCPSAWYSMREFVESNVCKTSLELTLEVWGQDTLTHCLPYLLH